MTRIYVFADEAGDFDFTRQRGASRYFMIGTATMDSCALGEEVLALRRELAWNREVRHEFHAHNDKRRVRDRVYNVIARSNVRIDATILDKTKTQDHLRADHLRFYKQAWFLHFKYVAPRIVHPMDELFVVTSSLQIKKKKLAIHGPVRDVVQQVSPTAIFRNAFWPGVSDPCLQVADYATWAVQRKYESEDTHAYDQISHLIETEFEPFKNSSKVYY